MKTAKEILDSLLNHYVERDVPASTGDAQDTALTELEEALLGIVEECDPSSGRKTGELYWGNTLRTQLKAFIGREE